MKRAGMLEGRKRTLLEVFSRFRPFFKEDSFALAVVIVGPGHLSNHSEYYGGVVEENSG